MRRLRIILPFAAAALTLAVVAAASATPSRTAASAKSAKIDCSKPMKIGFVTPLTGGAGFLGTEQLTWAKLGVKLLAPAMGLKITLVPFDTPVEQGPAPAQAAAQKFVADPTVVGVLGPSTSGAVAASSKTYFQAGIAHISPSATRTSLTKGAEKEATPAFFRVVPGDYVQGPSDAAFMINKLKVKKVVLFDFQEPYSQGLASAAETVLKAKGVSTIHLSAPNTTTDYSSYVTRVPSDADIVFFPTQKPGDAQTFARQLVEQGKKAQVFGGDGSNDPSQFKVPGSYVSNFAPDITGIAADAAIIAGCPSCLSRRFSASRRWPRRSAWPRAIWVRSVVRRRVLSQGFWTKSRAPRRIASTARSTVPQAVITMTGRSSSSSRIRPSRSRPSAPDVVSRV